MRSEARRQYVRENRAAIQALVDLPDRQQARAGLRMHAMVMKDRGLYSQSTYVDDIARSIERQLEKTT